MPKRSVPYDVVDYLKTPEDIAGYLNAAMEEDREEPGLFLDALGDAVRAVKGMSELSRDTGITREALHKALSQKGNPKIGNLFSVLHSVGLEFSVRPLRHKG